MATVTGHEVRTSNDLRCFCSRRPILAKYGVDDRGRMYVHVKIYKQRQIFGEVLAVDGQVKIICRECLRWHLIHLVKPEKAELREIPIPTEVQPHPFFRSDE